MKGGFAYPLTVRWGDCDPAGIVYTPNILGYAIEAVEGWFAAVLGESWPRIIAGRGLSTPMVHVSLDFSKPMRTGDRIAVEIEVTKIGGSTLTFAARGRDEQGAATFFAEIVSCFIDDAAYKAVPIPPDLRGKVEAYQAAT
jgi:4-hydroxybenzoyl-CoA thioesterase